MATGPDQIRWLNLTSRRTRIWPRGLLRWKASNEKLRTQMLATGELIQALSEQNALLVAQIDKFRRLTQRLAWCLAATAVVAGLALFIAWQPRITEFFA